MITLTDSAREKISEILTKQNNPKVMFRAFVEGGGCSGFQYGFTLDEEQFNEDYVIACGDFKVLVDSSSFQYLTGSTIDYKKELLSSKFVVDNPNTSSTCGCGHSFSA